MYPFSAAEHGPVTTPLHAAEHAADDDSFEQAVAAAVVVADDTADSPTYFSAKHATQFTAFSRPNYAAD